MTVRHFLVALLLFSVSAFWSTAHTVVDGGNEVRDDSLRLGIGVDVSTFFRNNEYHPDYQLGYTLPGWHLTPTVKLESRLVDLVGGIYSLAFLGAQRYPSGGWYDHLPHWDRSSANCYSGIHLRPVLSLQYRPKEYIIVSMGTLLQAQLLSLRGIASGSIDRRQSCLSLISPLYDPEYSFSRDPAQGAMVQLSYPRFALEALVDWQGFIFPGDTHQEAFASMLSSFYRLRISKTWTTQLQLQATAHHRAGEIQQMSPPDTLHTYLAGALGVATQWLYTEAGALEGSIHILGSSAHDGKLDPSLGYASYARLAWQRNILRLATDVMYGLRYYAPYGGPLLPPSTNNIDRGYWRLGFYPSLEITIPQFGELRLEGALWWSHQAFAIGRISHMISLTLSYHNEWLR